MLAYLVELVLFRENVRWAFRNVGNVQYAGPEAVTAPKGTIDLLSLCVCAY